MTLFALSACADAAGDSGAAPPAAVAFEGSAPSLEHLAEEVLRALAVGDVAALETLRLTEYEHNEVVWPELPAAAPEVHFPVDMAWSNIQVRDRSALARIVPAYEGHSPDLVGTECRGAPQHFESFVVLTDCWVVFTLDGSTSLLEAQLFKDVLLRSGGHKIFRYYDEEPRRHRSAVAG